MSEENNSPNYVVCDCKHCGEHIEFDSNLYAEDNSILPCPHCGVETKICIPFPQLKTILQDSPSPIASSNTLRREGFFCGEIGDEGSPITGAKTNPVQNTPYEPKQKPVQSSKEKLQVIQKRKPIEISDGPRIQSKRKATKAQLDYIRVLGGNPLTGLNMTEASALIEKLLEKSISPSEQPATEKQIQYIRDLGGTVPLGLSKEDAMELIPILQAKQYESFAKQLQPTPRQMMVLRFWNRMDLAQSSKWEVEQWLTGFYDEDPRRKTAWEIFKAEIGDDGSQQDPMFVPIGVAQNYLDKIN